MIPVVKVAKGSILGVMADNKRGDQLQRQDSGFLSGTPTPVTPSRHDINGPTYSNGVTSRDSTSHLPPIPERLNCREDDTHLEPQMESLSIRPSRPTTLSPHAPPPVPKEDTTMTPLTPGTALRHYSENPSHLVPKHIEEFLEKRANEIVQEVVPETPSDAIEEFKALPSSCEPVASSHIFPLQQIHCPINQEFLCPGIDGYYFEIRNYDRVDNEIIGEGGFGVVYACQDKIHETLFAIKSNKHTSEDKISEMKKECLIFEEIGIHNNITQVFGSLIDESATAYEGRKFKMLMECAINGTLSGLLTDPETKEISGLPLDQSLYYLQQILYAVRYLHQKTILHLDLKCANVLVFNEGRTVKLTDFGCAVRLDRPQGAPSQILKGYTPNFSAPEVIRGREPVSFSADIWSVMCCLIEMLTGYLPWCYKESPGSCITVQSIIILVGNYNEKENFERLLSKELCEELELSLDVVELFKSVFKRDSSMRPTALHLLENPLIKNAHEYERLFDEYAYTYEEAVTPSGATPTYETKLLGVKKSSSTESHSSIDSGNYDRSSSSNTSSPGSAGPLIDDSSRNNNFPMSVIPDSTFRGLETQFADMSFTTYRPPSLTSSSAPSDMTGGCWEDNGGRGRGLFTGQDDNERDGARPVMGRGQLKRTTSANYVSNGPEVDSPDGRHHHRSFPQASFVKNNSVISSNIVTVGMVSVGTQTSLSPTIESMSPLGSQTTFLSSSIR